MAKLPRIVYLVIGIPVSSLLLGVVMLVAATRGNVSEVVPTPHQPLSKTSWQQPQSEQNQP